MTALDTQRTDPPAPPGSGAGHLPHALPLAPGLGGRIVFLIAVAFALYQLWSAAYAPLSSLVMRSLHVGFLLLMTYSLAATRTDRSPAARAIDAVLGVAAFVLAFYHLVFEEDILYRAGWPNATDIAVGVATLVLLFEAARRTLGVALPIICLLFLGYASLGEYLPYPLNHRGYGFDQVIDQMYLGTEGIYGIPTLVSATYIFLFILFGSILERAGMVRLFTDLALGTVGHTRGGPAKVAVVSSALMGTINGSGVANVVTTGQFTIPLMKRFGFRAPFAGAVEATASMGGQIMPPVMGAVAFIMAETLNVPYIQVVKAALVPALLYFATVFWMVHLEAGRLRLTGIPKEECPDPWMAVRTLWYLILPLAVLVAMLFSGFTPLFAGLVALALTGLIMLGLPVARRTRPRTLRVVFWIALGALAGLFDVYGITAIVLLVAALLLANLAFDGGRATVRTLVESLAEGSRNALGVGVACALVGVIIGTMTLTGLATNFARVIISVGENNLFLSLVLTMLTCLVLGMGIPTIPNYIITSSLVGPALLELGVPLIVSHMFVFYFGIMADLTPPVALAAFAASPIAKASGLRIGINCMRVAIAGFVVPFMAVYAPVLMLQHGGPLADAIGYPAAVVYMIAKALLAIGLWGAASIGYLFGPLSWPERLGATAAAFCLVLSLPASDAAGLALAAGVVALHVLRSRRAAA